MFLPQTGIHRLNLKGEYRDYSRAPTALDQAFWCKAAAFMSDAEGLTKNIAASLADLYEGTEDSFAPERHAPAERAIQTLKGIGNT